MAASEVLASLIRAMVSLYSPMVVVPPPVSSSICSMAPRMSLTSEVNGAPDLQRPVERHDHAFGVRPDGRRHEFLQAPEHPVPVHRLDVQVVDVEDVLGLHIVGHFGGLLLGAEVERLAVLEQELPARDRVEVRDRLNDAVLLDLEVRGRQARHAVALGVRDDDLDARHRNVDRLDDRREGPLGGSASPGSPGAAPAARGSGRARREPAASRTRQVVSNGILL